MIRQRMVFSNFNYALDYFNENPKIKCLLLTGRPNAGKSSLIGILTNSKVIRGKKPGTTKSLKVFFWKDICVIDSPGFGKIMGFSRKRTEETKKALVEFIEDMGPRINLAVHVIDLSTFHRVSESLLKKNIIPIDLEMLDFLNEVAIQPIGVVGNKFDKTTPTEARSIQRTISDSISFPLNYFILSCKTKYGIGSFKSWIHSQMKKKNK